eukprot:359747-Chlamydomonas_euryale.AAC.1
MVAPIRARDAQSVQGHERSNERRDGVLELPLAMRPRQHARYGDCTSLDAIVARRPVPVAPRGSERRRCWARDGHGQEGAGVPAGREGQAGWGGRGRRWCVRCDLCMPHMSAACAAAVDSVEILLLGCGTWQGMRILLLGCVTAGRACGAWQGVRILLLGCVTAGRARVMDGRETMRPSSPALSSGAAATDDGPPRARPSKECPSPEIISP